MWRRHRRATGRGKGEGKRWRLGAGSCPGPARALPHARAHSPSPRRTSPSNPPPPAPARRVSARRFPQLPPSRDSVRKLVPGCTHSSAPGGPRRLGPLAFLWVSSRYCPAWRGRSQLPVPHQPPAGAPLSQVGWAELWFPAPYAPPLPSRALAKVASPRRTERVSAPLPEASLARAQLLLVAGEGAAGKPRTGQVTLPGPSQPVFA